MSFHASPRINALHGRRLSLVAGLLIGTLVQSLQATSFTISGASGTAQTLNAGETGTVTSAGVLSTSGGTTAVAMNGTATLTVDGTVQQSGTGRAVRTGTGVAVYTVNVGATGVVKAIGDDAIQVRNGTFNLTNGGTIYSGPNLALTPATALASGQALDLSSAIGGTIVNETTGLIRADGHDAVRLGSNMSLTNHGTIIGNGVVNDSPANNAFNTAPLSTNTAETFSANEGLSFENGSNSSVNNFGLISGSRHGVETDVSAASIVITNQAGGQMIGRNGSGVGSDATSASVNNIIVHNSGIIRGEYAGAGNVVDRTGSLSPTQDGDGDGVDIDGAATINNHAGGQIIGNGAGGFDSGGRANTSDGISIGGGVIHNEGLIRGAGVGIVVNNDSVASRSGVAATSITNTAGATIEGQNGYAIRLENKLGDVRDNDNLTNAGTIIGGGTIPNPAGTVLRQDGLVDPNSTGTLDGVAYNGTGAMRFIKGDGSAIQMGEGVDTLTNTGTIIGSTGRAINMEGGDDTVNINGGSISGAIDGGAGSDNLSFNLAGPDQAFVQNGAITRFEHIEIASGNVQLTGALDLGSDTNTLVVQSGGILNLGDGALTMDHGSVVADGVLQFLLGGSNHYGQLFFASGNLGGLTLTGTSTLDLELGYIPLAGEQFTLVDFLGGSFASGTFAGLAEGSMFWQEGYQFQITYQGNGGNDIVLTRTVPEAGATIGLLIGAFGLMGWVRSRLRAQG